VSERKNVVRVTILGETHSIRSDASAEHTRAVAEYVDRAIQKVMHTSPMVETQRAAILAALQITDELFRARESADELERKIVALSGDIRRWLPPAKRGETTAGGAAGSP
jgi:cell division protein ZapA